MFIEADLMPGSEGLHHHVLHKLAALALVSQLVERAHLRGCSNWRAYQENAEMLTCSTGRTSERATKLLILVERLF